MPNPYVSHIQAKAPMPVHRAVIEALRALPEDFFSERERSRPWPYDLVGHVAEHRRKRLERVLRPST